jgi:antimicrobial peptide system SdpB family protein
MNNFFEKTYALTTANIQTNYFGLARTILALGLLSTLIFNSNEVLFTSGLRNENLLNGINLNYLSIYNVFNNIFIAKIVSIFILIICASGFYPRYLCLLHWWVTFSFCNSSYIIDGGDQIASITSFLIIPICLIDNRKNHFQVSKTQNNFYSNTITYFSFLLIQAQTVVIYLHSGIGKFKSKEWVDGTALYYWFNNSLFGMPDYLVLPLNYFFKFPIFVTYFTWSIILIELFIAFAILQSSLKYKKIALFLGVFLHFFIVLIHGLSSFYFSMASILIISLYSKNNNFRWTNILKRH